MTPELNEDEFFTLKTNHFEQILQDSISVKSITTVHDLEYHL